MVVKKQSKEGFKWSFLGIVYSLLFLCSFISSPEFSDRFNTPKHFYLVFSSLTVLAVLGIHYFFSKKRTEFTFNYIDSAIFIYIFYVIIHFTVGGKNPFNSIRLINLTIPILVYFFYRPVFNVSNPINHGEKFTRSIITLIILIGIVQSFYAFLQLAGKLDPLQEEFRFGGAYGNPGPFANVMVAILPFSISTALFSEKGTIRNLSILSALCILVIIPFTMARTSWIAAVVSIGFIILYLPAVRKLVSRYLSGIKQKILFAAVIIVLLFSSVFALISFKQDSASGRMFIWKVSGQMIAEKPILGHGYSSYAAVHNNYQADYFRMNPEDDKNAWLADGINYAFNEYIQIACEIGIIGLILFLLIIIVAFKGQVKAFDKDSASIIGAKGAILAVLVSSMFSYPFHSITVLLLLFTSLAIIAGNSNGNVIFNRIVNPLQRRILVLSIISVVSVIAFLSSGRMKAEKRWTEAFLLVRNERFIEAQSLYEELYPILAYNPFFLFNYGAELSVMESYDKSIKIFKEVGEYLNDADYWIYLGNSYEGAGYFSKALSSYEQASFIMPVKFYPRYRLVKLYDRLGDTEKALDHAYNLTQKEVKVESEIVMNIKLEMEEYLEKHDKY